MLSQYLAAKGMEIDGDSVEIGPFGDGSEMADQLLSLILSGRKRATCWARLNSEQAPEAGILTVVTDWDGGAGCVIETVRGEIMRFGDMTWALAQKEGEDDCLCSWRENHIRFFTEEGKREDYSFSEDMEIIFEEFRVVWPEELADEK